MKYAILAIIATASLATNVAAKRPVAPRAKLTMLQARVIALNVAPGRVVGAEYEKEGGGWRYSFDIRQGKRIHEIGVDGNTGKIVEDKFEGLKDRD